MGTSAEQWEAAWEGWGSSSHGATDEISDEPSIRDSVSQRVMHPIWESKHKVFLSHSAAQKRFVSEQLNVELGLRARYPFLDIQPESLPLGEPFPKLIFDGIKRCMVVVVVLSEEFFTRGKWPMLEVAAMVRRKKSDSRFNIIPVFFSISPDKCHDNLTQWKSHWETLKSKDELWSKLVDDDMKEDMKIDINEWEKALNFLLDLGGIIKGEGMTESECCAKIVEEVCKLVPRENRWITNSDIQGRDHLLKKLQEVVFPMLEQDKPNLGMRLVGLYGVQGSGKSTLSKVLCNEASMEFCNKVHYIQLPSSRKGLENLSLVQLQQQMLKEFTYLRHDVIGALDEVECSTYLRTVKDKVFLVIDNVIDDSKSIKLAKGLKASPFGNGSVILIISSSSDVLVKNLGINERDCLDLLDLREDDAKALFLDNAIVPPNFPKNGDEESLLM